MTITRRPDFAGGGITPEEKTRMDEHTQLWIKRALRTAPIESNKIIPAIRGLYAAANLSEPRIVVVPSPIVMAIAGGFASAIWWRRKNGATLAATLAATDAATSDATDAATLAATVAATDAATVAATVAATDAATDAATLAATVAATDAATLAATDAATRVFSWVAPMARQFAGSDELLYRVMLESLPRWYSQYQGGNMWAAWDCYLTAARDILGLKLPQHEKYAAWEQAAIHGGFRLMNPHFCMVCDFPEVLKIDSRNRPHCEDGPSHRWRDGWSLYYWHGVRVAEWIIEQPEIITVEKIDGEPNMEIRRVMVERYGMARYVKETGAECLDESPELGVRLLRKTVGSDQILLLHMRNSTVEPDGTVREFISRLHSELKPLPPADMTGATREKWYADHKAQKLTARNAVASSFGLYGEHYAPEFQS